MEIKKEHDITALNTFGLVAKAGYFAEVHNEIEIKELFNSVLCKENQILFLGGGSNILFTKDFKGLVVLNKLHGIEIVKEDDEYVFIRSMGGELWHELVLFTVSRGYWGIENLALIPGTVGAAPIQNIGAYGVELKSIIDTVEGIDIATGEKRIFTIDECDFGYRESAFKHAYKNKYFISAVILKLKKKPDPHISYKILADFIKNNNLKIDNPQNISDAVSEIRRSKLPDPKIIGNAGSFFKNVFLKKEKINTLHITYPDMPFFEEDGYMKVPAAWFIEKCGWKGYRQGSIGVHDKQALVLVNYGGAKGIEIQKLAEKIITSVYNRFDVTLTTEVNFI